jgi:DNA-directed RNA polymerase specialized sigma24 family protein
MWSVKLQELEKLVDMLPAVQRRALELVAVERHSYEAASKAACTIGIMKSRVSRACSALVEATATTNDHEQLDEAA